MQEGFLFLSMNGVESGDLLSIFPKQMQCILETKEKDAVISICQVGNQTVDYVLV